MRFSNTAEQKEEYASMIDLIELYSSFVRVVSEKDICSVLGITAAVRKNLGQLSNDIKMLLCEY